MTAPTPVSELLDRLEEARAEATPGPWRVAQSGAIDAGDYDTVIGPGDVNCMSRCYGGSSTIEGDNLAADAACIVAEHNATGRLIEWARQREVLRKALEELAGEMESWGGHHGPAFDYAADRLRVVVASALAEEEGR